jgi:hypothetical protein
MKTSSTLFKRNSRSDHVSGSYPLGLTVNFDLSWLRRKILNDFDEKADLSVFPLSPRNIHDIRAHEKIKKRLYSSFANDLKPEEWKALIIKVSERIGHVKILMQHMDDAF